MMQNVRLKCVVIDDSSIQRASLIYLIRQHKNLELVGEYHNGINARKSLQENKAELIFLDIEMPIVSGFELLESLDHRPQVIVVTGNPDHAMQAFNYDATDYLLKPIMGGRFQEAIRRALNQHLASSVVSAEENFIYVNSNLKKVKILTNGIKWIEGYGDYIKLVTESKTHLVLTTMKAFMARLPDNQFFRIHKSYIVNMEKVEKFNAAFVEIGGKELPLSRKIKEEFEEALMND